MSPVAESRDADECDAVQTFASLTPAFRRFGATKGGGAAAARGKGLVGSAEPQPVMPDKVKARSADVIPRVTIDPVGIEHLFWIIVKVSSLRVHQRGLIQA
jgi:hypothetical protein